jgi:predicted lipoprotein with Yx(FWY)xxD motif
MNNTTPTPMSTGVPSAVPTATPAAMAPTTAPTMAPAGTTTLPEATLLGAPGFENTNGRTVYVLSNDTVTSLACTVASGCTGVWPPVAPPSGVALSTGFTVFTRPDNSMVQLAFNNHPVYEFAGDSGAGQTNGNGLMSFGGTWSIAHP